MLAFWPFTRGRAERSSEQVTEEEILPCGRCLRCVTACPSGALQYRNRKWYVNLTACIFCRSCAEICPNHLISSN